MTLQTRNYRSHCSIARTLELLGDKWTLLVVRDLIWHDKHTYGSFRESAEAIPTNILAERLKRLEEAGLVTKKAYQERPVRYRYNLTAAGRSLEPMLLAIMQWGHAHLGGGLHDPRAGQGGPSGG